MVQELLRKSRAEKLREAEKRRKREALRAQTKQSQARARSESNEQEKRPVPWRLYIWLTLVLLVSLGIGRVTYISYQEYIDPQRVYGEWIETAAPEYDTDVFTISEQGVVADSRYIATSIEFDGDIVAFRSGNIQYEYQLFGEFDQKLRRVAGKGHAAVFVKKGYEHTVPDADSAGPARRRRVSLAEHFKSKE